MKRSLKDIDKLIEQLLTALSKMQNADGSFDTMYIQPFYNHEKGWMNYPGNAAFTSASALVPLVFIKSEKAKEIIERGCDFFLNNSFEQKLWKFANLSEEYIVPFDSDSTSLCSYILESAKINIPNKSLLNRLINNKNNYSLWIISNKVYPGLSLLGNLKLWFYNQRVKKSIPYLSRAIHFNDFEFSVTCNNLLYLGHNENENVWDHINYCINENSISHMYYPDFFHSFYIYARLYRYGNNKDGMLNPDLYNKYTDSLYNQLTRHDNSLNHILLANSVLFLNSEIGRHDLLFEECFNDIEKGKFDVNAPYYSSNVLTDIQPGNNKPNTYFGSPAITCSLYLEFLNIYRINNYGSYFGFN